MQLFLQLDSGTDLDRALAHCAIADGIAVPGSLAPKAFAAGGPGCRIVEGSTPGDAPHWAAHEGAIWAADRGLDASARLRDRWPDVRWVPRARVYRPAPRFDFCPGSHEEGFKTYMPDLATYRCHRVTGEEVDLRDWLNRACELGFDTAWLHSADAAARDRGLDLDMLERASACFAGSLWISGGTASPGHLETLTAQGGAHATIVPLAVACDAGVPALRAALRPKVPVMTSAPAGARSCEAREAGGTTA